MALPFYSTGTATLTNGLATMTGQGTDWSLSAYLRKYDRVESLSGHSATVLSIVGPEEITLDRPFTGTSQVAAAYKIWRTADEIELLAAARAALGLIGNGNLATRAALASAINTIGYFTGAGTEAITGLSAFGRSLIDDANAAAAYATLGTIPESALPDRLRGAGGAIPSNNYNLAVLSGFYAGAGGSAVNGPADNTAFGPLLVFGLTSARIMQIASYQDQMNYRGSVDNGATWSAWRPLAPLIASNANGTYMRVGAMQICTHTWAHGNATLSAWGNVFLGSQFAWTFPAAFSAAPKLAAQVSSDGNRKWVTGGGSPVSTTQGFFQSYGALSTGTACDISLTAIGTW